MKYRVTSESILSGNIFDITTTNFEEIFPLVIGHFLGRMHKNGIPVPTDTNVQNGEDKIVFTYSYPINSDPVSIVFNIEKIN